MRIELENVSKAFETGVGQVKAVQGVTMTVEPGEMVAITGRSGSGKSTLVNLMGGIERPTSGSIRLGGETLDHLSRKRLAQVRRRHLGYVFQDLNLIPVLTATENVALPLELDGMRRSQAASLSRRALLDVLPKSVLDRFPDQLSGGEQQRVAIARALCGHRSVLLAD